MAYLKDKIFSWTDDEGIKNFSNRDPRDDDRTKAFNNIVSDVRSKRQGATTTPIQGGADPSGEFPGVIDPEKAYRNL